MNFWIGCQEVGPACDHCYAREFTNARLNAARTKAGLPTVDWGPGGARQLTSQSNRKKPLRWQRIAADAGVTLNVFCSSLSDWADNAVPDSWRAQMALTILDTPNLNWMLLTKRIGNAEEMLRAMFPAGVPGNVSLGITIANQQEADRDIPKALAVKDALKVPRLFLSMEPLLGPVDLAPKADSTYKMLSIWYGPEGFDPTGSQPERDRIRGLFPLVDLVIVGGESGKDARPMDAAWATSLRDQCAAAGVPFHFKQWGEWLPGGQGNPHGADLGRYEVLIEGTPPDAVEKAYRVGVRNAGHFLDRKEHREHFKC